MRIGVTERGDGGLQIVRVLEALESNRVNGAIIITKFPHLVLLERDILPKNSVIHCTITGMGSSMLEPIAGFWRDDVVFYHKLVEKYGPERIVLRVDPILPLDRYVSEAAQVIQQQRGRVRISFLDMYPHVRQRLQDKIPSLYTELNQVYGNALHSPLDTRKNYLELLKEITPDIEVCGEPDLPCTGCISVRDLNAMGLDVPQVTKEGHIRAGCKCLTMKTELLNNRHPCRAKCLYCYWKD